MQSCFAQKIPYKKDGKQQAAYYFLHQPISLPKAFRQLSSKQVLCKRVSFDDPIVSAGVLLDVGKYYPLDSFRMSENFVIVNFSDSSLLLFRHIKSLLAIREVRTSDGKWIPIEHQSWSDCRTGDNPILLRPGQLILVRTRKVGGTKTGIVRLKIVARNNRKNLLYSESFQSSISTDRWFIDSTHRDFSVYELYSNLFLTDSFAALEYRRWTK